MESRNLKTFQNFYLTAFRNYFDGDNISSQYGMFPSRTQCDFHLFTTFMSLRNFVILFL